MKFVFPTCKDVFSLGITDADNKNEAFSVDEFIKILKKEAFEEDGCPYFFPEIPSLLIEFHSQIDAFIEELPTATEQAYTKLRNWGETDSILLKIVATFFLSYCDYLIETYPDRCQSLIELRDKNRDITIRLYDWDLDKYEAYAPYIDIYWFALDIIKGQKNVGLLSPPTHSETLWVNSFIFVERLIQYHSTHTIPNDMDMQLAIQRIGTNGFENEERALIDHLRNSDFETEEFAGLLAYLMLGELPNPDCVVHRKWWLTAAITRQDGIGYKCFLDEDTMHIPAVFFENSYDVEISPSGIDIKIPTIAPVRKTKKLFYEYLFTCTETLYREADLPVILSSFPNNHDVLMARLISCGCTEDKWTTSFYYIIQTIISRIHRPYTPLQNLFTAILMLQSNSGVGKYVAKQTFYRLKENESLADYYALIFAQFINSGLHSQTSNIAHVLNEMFLSAVAAMEGYNNNASETNQNLGAQYTMERFIAIMLENITAPVQDLEQLLNLNTDIRQYKKRNG